MQELIQIALVGTANVSNEVSSLPAIDALIPKGSREQQLLQQAGAQAIYRAAGRMPKQIVLPVSAPDETLPELPRTLMPILHAAIADGLCEFTKWLISRMVRYGYRLPASLLPTIFAHPKSASAWQSVMGQRGHWLAMQNPQWQKQLPLAGIQGDESELLRAWEEGNTNQRGNALAELRLCDPHKGREWLIAALPKEKADQRQLFTEKLANGLCLDDEPLLESLLNDRSQTVRQTAANLLARLPGSALLQRMLTRADACLRWQVEPTSEAAIANSTSLPRQKTGSKLIVEIPQELPKDWERDGIVSDTSSGRRIRASWLRKLVSLVPPAHWVARTNLGPELLLSMMKASEWRDALLAGFTHASYHFADSNWSAVLLARAIDTSTVLNPIYDVLWPIARAEVRDSLLCQELLAGRTTTVLRGLRNVPAPWSSSLIETISHTVFADGRGQRTPEEVLQRDDLAELVELALMRTADEDLPKLASLIDLYAARVADSQAVQDRIFKWAQQIVAIAQIKQTVIKEMSA